MRTLDAAHARLRLHRERMREVSDAIGPRQVGGTYWCGYSHRWYVVESIEIRFRNGKLTAPTWSITARWASGERGTPWDPRYDSSTSSPSHSPGPAPAPPELRSPPPSRAGGAAPGSRSCAPFTVRSVSPERKRSMSAALLPNIPDRAAGFAPSREPATDRGRRALGVLRRHELVRWHGRDEIARAYVHPERAVIEVPNRPWPIGRPAGGLRRPHLHRDLVRRHRYTTARPGRPYYT
ncbi:hypothetical protein [Amycolatopsis sp. cg9]|uniref:hypothetical protein n=1 Tax=Amycolatopsis sp. cg9 TaxID=3238801 RepID=UPI00352541AA